jgi:nucleotide-binding universal stress UspA family protein
MFDRIVLAIDGSEPSHRAEETPATLAGLAGSEVIVHPPRALPGPGDKVTACDA